MTGTKKQLYAPPKMVRFRQDDYDLIVKLAEDAGESFNYLVREVTHLGLQHMRTDDLREKEG